MTDNDLPQGAPAAAPSETATGTATAAEPAAPAESFGRYLLRERELRGVSLEQIAEQTRIGMSYLRALEQDDLSRLPPRVFVLGFIRAYAHVVGLSPDEAALRFDELHQEGKDEEVSMIARLPRRRRFALAVLVAAAVVAVGVAIWLLQR
jgi:cytoskeletal protein RodZ